MNENRLFFSYCHAERKRMDEIVPWLRRPVSLCGGTSMR